MSSAGAEPALALSLTPVAKPALATSANANAIGTNREAMVVLLSGQHVTHVLLAAGNAGSGGSHIAQIVDQPQAAEVWSRHGEPVTVLTPAWRVIGTLH